MCTGKHGGGSMVVGEAPRYRNDRKRLRFLQLFPHFSPGPDSDCLLSSADETFASAGFVSLNTSL